MIKTVDRKMQELVQLATTVASSKATVLIQGESGTGKELIARLIHDSSSRKSQPFVAINCAAIPENLLEAELFGFEKGAFTGAHQSSPGKFKLAEGGTILLDEISEMDIRLQAKLLRVLQESQVDRIGARKPEKIDVRILATTNQNLGDCVRAGSFREDLFYRLNVVHLTLPPLREREGDIKLLAEMFLKQFAQRHRKMVRGFSHEALQMLLRHEWPGNIRELEHTLERAVLTTHDMLLTTSVIHLIKAPLRPVAKVATPEQKWKEGSERGWAPGKTLDDIEKTVILEALKYHQGNRTHTARDLGISIRTLRNKIAEFRSLGIHV